MKHYLTNEQLEYFRSKLLSWKSELLRQNTEIKDVLQNTTIEADNVDSACNLTTQNLDIRNQERARKLIKKIDIALEKIKDGTYGYCEETGEPIGLHRLEARPIATLCIEAQERHEKNEHNFHNNSNDIN